MKLFKIVIICCLLTSCHHSIKFDSASWKEQSEIGKYPKRKFIVDDLIKSYQLKGLSYKEVIQLLGTPFPKDLFKIDTLLYPIDMKFNQQDQLIGAKSLLLKCSSDSIVQDVEIMEWGK